MTTAAVGAKAREVGFDLCGVAAAVGHPRLARLADWIAEGRAGDMHYLRDSLDERLDVRAALPTARSVIALASVYNTPAPLSTDAAGPARAAIARYAWGDDYHEILRARVRELLVWLSDEAGPGLEAFSCVDDGPIQERVFAEQAGLGWIGKNTCLINPDLGSWLFLAEIVTNLPLDPDTPGFDQCGACTRCLDACPTGAIVEPWVVDATACLAYVTIEQRSPVSGAMREAIGPQVFGCDICQDVCPWNRRAAVSADPAWQPRDGLLFPRLVDLCRLSDEAWRELLSQSAMRRAGLRRIRRSLACAAVHLAPAEAAEALDALGRHETARAPEVAEALGWARSRLDPAGGGGTPCW